MPDSDVLSNDSTSRTRSSFSEIGLAPDLAEAAERLRLDEPTEVQRLLVPAFLAGRSSLVLARSGSGKTNAYLLPLLQMIKPGEGAQAIIFAPHRELVRQIARALHRFHRERPLHPAMIVPGRPERMPGAVRPDEADILIGTPAAIREAIERDGLNTGALRYVVIDETDAQLDGEKGAALHEAVAALNVQAQFVILAGRIDAAVREFADRFAQGIETLDLPAPDSPLRTLPQHYVTLATKANKPNAVAAFVASHSPRMVFLFSNSDECVRDLQNALRPLGVDCSLLDTPTHRRGRPGDHGRGRDGPPPSVVVVVRDPTPRKVGSLPFSHALHYELPEDPAVYAARLDECVRVSRDGFSLALVAEDEHDTLDLMQSKLNVALSPLDGDWLTMTPPPLPTGRERRRDERGPGRGHDDRRGGRPGADRGRDGGRSHGGERAPGHGRGAGHTGERGRGAPQNRGPAREGGRSNGEHEPARPPAAPPAPSAPRETAPPPKPAAKAPSEPSVPSRLAEGFRRDAHLDSQGIKPVRRTLGSRFRPVRGRRLQPPQQ